MANPHSCLAELTVDFGEVGHRNDKHPFRVRLECTPLADLIRDARDAHRVYELFLIDRPGDIWEYIDVVIEAVPPRIASFVEYEREKISTRNEGASTWPADRVPFMTFDALFFWTWDDTGPADAAWLNYRDSNPMRSFARHVLTIVRDARGSLGSIDELLRHIVDRVQREEHPFIYLDRAVAKEKGRDVGPSSASHSAAFYQKLAELLTHPKLAAVAYRAHGDYRVMRMMATEQRRRAALTSHTVGNALELNALVSRKPLNATWDSRIWFYDEGLGHGDLFIQGTGLGSGSVQELAERHRMLPSRFVLCGHDEGDISGFDKETGEGWVLYRKQRPYTRRTALECVDHRHGKLGPILAFEERGGTLFEYDKTVLVIGHAVPPGARVILADTISEWQRFGGDPLVVVQGDATAFNHSGCRDMLQVPAKAIDDKAMEHRLWTQLRHAHHWIDAVVALAPPKWASGVLAERLRHVTNPWEPWIVSTDPIDELHVDCLLEGDLVRILTDAQFLARGRRLRP